METRQSLYPFYLIDDGEGLATGKAHSGLSQSLVGVMQIGRAEGEVMYPMVFLVSGAACCCRIA
jgi:hypothetical protein